MAKTRSSLTQHKTAKIDWNVPDWTSDEGYPDPLEASPRQWAWEFYRRSNESRARWASQSGDFVDVTKRKPNHLPQLTMEARVNVVIGKRVPQLLPHQAAIVIDLQFSIDRQLKVAKAKIAEEPAASKLLAIAEIRLRPREYLLYLRAMDGRDAGASIADIGKVLKRNRKDITRYLTMGDRFAQGGYLQIARTNDERPNSKRKN